MDSRIQKRQNLLVYCILALGTFALFFPVLKNPFLNFDDPDYVTSNRHVLTGLSFDNLWWAFTSAHASNWHPLTWMSHMTDCLFFKGNPAGHHLTNLLFHIANSLLLFAFLRRTTGAFWPSTFVAALFAWHPLHVESVAWISERKDVLSTFFWLLTMMAYVRYTEKPGRKRYLITLGLFCLGLLSKPMVVTLPFVLILLDWWPLRRISGWHHHSSATASPAGTDIISESPNQKLTLLQSIYQKLPFFAVAAASSVITFMVQGKAGAVASLATAPITQRFSNAAVAYVRYLGKAFWPTDLAIFYPSQPWSFGQVALAVLFLAMVSLLVIILCARRPYLLTGWLWFLGTLVPVIGLVQVGSQSMADRYTYIPLIGFFIMIIWEFDSLARHLKLPRWSLGFAGTIMLASLILATHFELRFWDNTITLFEHAQAVTSPTPFVHTTLGDALDHEGKSDDAIAQYKAALQLDPHFAYACFGMGVVYSEKGNFAQATNYYHAALTNGIQNAHAVHYWWGNALVAEGKLPEAADHYTQSVRIRPDYAISYHGLGKALIKLGHLKDAIDCFKTELRLQPDLPEAHDELAGAYAKLGSIDAALFNYREAIRIAPEFAHAHRQLGILLAQTDKLAEAMPHFEKSAQLEPTNSVAHFTLASGFEAQGKLDQAASEFREVIRLNPNDYEAHRRLGGILARQHKFAEALKAYREALAVNPDSSETLANIAWLLATNPQPDLQNGSEAVQLAEKACRIGKKEDLRFLVALDAAYARAGRFDEAIKTAQQVQQQAAANNQKSLADAAAKRIELYKAGSAYQQ